MKISYGKLAAIAILTLMLTTSTIAIIPRLFTTSAFEYPPGTWRIKLQDLGNNTVPAGSVTVYLWNLTERTIAPAHAAWSDTGPIPHPTETYLLSYATVGANGIVSFPGLPGDTWDEGDGVHKLTYAISANYTYEGAVTDIIVLPLLVIYDQIGGAPVMISLAGLLNDTTVTIGYHFTWEDLDATETDQTRPGYIVYLAPVAFRVIDEAGFPLVGAGVEFWAQVWTDNHDPHNVTIADFIQIATATANGTFGSEFIGNMPYAIPIQDTLQFVDTDPASWTGSHNVGWVEVVLPALMHDETVTSHGFNWQPIVAWSGLQNITFLVRYKTSDPTVGPIVGRFVITWIYTWPHTVWTPVTGTDTDPPYDTVHTEDMLAYLGDQSDYVRSGNMYPYVWCNVRWKYENLTDVSENPWWTKEAEVFMKWEQGPIGSFQFVGTNVAPGRVLMRYPCNLEHVVPLVDDSGYGFTLTLGVEWRFSIVKFRQGILPEQLPESDPGFGGPFSHTYGLVPGTSKDTSDFGHMNDPDWILGDNIDVASNVLVCNMSYVKGIKLDSSTEIPQALRNEIALKIILPAGLAHTINASFVWVTNNTGFVMLPDTTAIRADSDIYDLLTGTTYLPNDLNFSGWLPIVYHGQTNFLAWFQGIKVLDTTVDGGYPAGNLPLPLGSKLHPGLNYGKQWNYSMAIYELGFVLEFTPAPNGDPRPVPYYTPFFFRYPNGELIGPTITVPSLDPETHNQTYGIYDLVKAAPGGTYSDFMIVWKGAVIRASNLQSITLDDNRNNTLLVFPVYDLNVTGWSQDPFVLVNVKVELLSKTDFAEFGLPFYIVRMLVDPEAAWYSAVLPAGWTLWDYTGPTGFPFWEYRTEAEWIDGHAHTLVTPAMFEKLPAKAYEIRISTSNDVGAWGVEGRTALGAGFRSVDINVTLYWTGDPWIGAPYQLTGHAALDIDTYVYNPRLSIEDAGGAPLALLPGTQSAIFLVEPWYADGALNDFYDHKIAGNFNPYFVRINSTDATGHATLESVNATAVSPPTDPHFNRLADDFPEESRYLIGESTLESAPPYRFMVYYKGVLVFNESVPLHNPYEGKDHPIITSVYPYIFKVTNYPLPDETWRFGIQNLDVDVFWAGLNLTWWPSFSLVTETAVKEFSLLNASKLEKGFNMSVVERLWGPTPVNPVTLIEIPYTPVPPYFCSNLFVENGVSDVNGEFKVLVPVWNYSYSNHTFTYLAVDDVFGTWGEEKVGGPAMPWVKALGPLGITLPTWAARQMEPQGFFGTPVYANWTTIPGTTNNIPADDIVRLAATLEPAWLALEQDHIWWWVYSVNATGLVNTETYYGDTPADDIVKSLNTTSRAPAELWGGIGMLSGGVFQGRQAVDIFEDTVVGPPQPYANFYAKLQVMTIANDIGVVVLDSPDFSGGGVLGYGNDLPNQYVEVWNLGDVDVDIDAMLYHGYTPLDSPSILYVRSTPTNIFWGFYYFEVATTNLTQITNNSATTHDLQKDWELDPQWLVAELPGGSIDWWSTEVFLQWPTKLQLTIYAGDSARYLHNAWVFIVDAVTNDNITAALTDDAGYPNSIDLTDPALITAWALDPLATGNPSGSRLNLGFNLGYEGWAYTIPDGFGDIHVYCTSGSGKWIVKVFWKAPDAGAVKTFGKIDGVSVWDTFRDQPQHRYIYLGIDMPPSATGEDNATCQVRTFNTKVYDLKLKVLDQSPSARAIVSAPVTITMPDASPVWVMSKTTTAAGEVTLNLVPAGKYQVVATSPVALFGKPASQITASVEARVIDAPATIIVPLPIFDATVTLVTPSGKPIVGATITVGGVALGTTDAAGNALAASIPSGSYTVTSSWFGQDISPTVPLTVTLSRTYLLTASKIALVQIQVVGAQNQGLPQAAVTVKIGTTTVFTGMTNNDGVAAMELPFGTYSVTASHKGVEATATIAVTGDTVQKITTGVFIELFGQGLTFAGFALWVIAILIVVLILVIAAQEYNIYRRKRLPQLFGAGPTR